ncbi:nucleolar protein 9-like isoform X1 [Tetranychus urticae]|uniref:nucleolar protein 9-like isoform X1 n=2 Tax=Tetranychus urticae TaxID=32264 RepID=UPI00077C0048|nr:nucleolar protein 9-like isoform X1 [Tetranychus urticae]
MEGVTPNSPRTPSPLETIKRIDFDVDYFNRMSRRIQDGFKDDIDRVVFVESIMKTVKGKELDLSGFKHPSTCIQWVIENSTNLVVIKSLALAFYPKGLDTEILSNQHTSRVIQLLLEASLKILSNEYTFGGHRPETPTRHGKWTEQFICAFSQFVIINMDTILSDGNGTHVMVTVIEALGGVRIGRHWSRKTIGFALKSSIITELEKDNVIKEIPPSFTRLMIKIAKKLIIRRPDRDLKEIILGRGTALIQNLLFILMVRLPEVCEITVKRLVYIIFSSEENKFAITTNSASAYLVEAIMLVCSQRRLTQLWHRYLKGKLMEMWKDDIANFVVQRLIDAVQDIDLFKYICDEVFPELGNVFAYNRAGIGVCLAKACLRFKSMQEPFVNALITAFNCEARQIHLVPAMLFGELKHRRSLWLHGSLMLQYIFRFEDPCRVSRSLISLEPHRLVEICSDKSGSHVIDCFLKSDNVPEKFKAQFKEKMRSCSINSVTDEDKEEDSYNNRKTKGNRVHKQRPRTGRRAPLPYERRDRSPITHKGRDIIFHRRCNTADRDGYQASYSARRTTIYRIGEKRSLSRSPSIPRARIIRIN